MAQQTMTREALLERMELTWDTFLPTVDALTIEEQTRYAQANGYTSLKQLIAHLNEWWRELLRVVPSMARGDSPKRDWDDITEFDRRATTLDGSWTIEQHKEDFETLRSQVAAMIAELPESAFSHPQITRWLNEAIIHHYDKHAPPGDPQIPSARHGGQSRD